MLQFFITLIIVILCCRAMGIGLLLSGRPLAGGCGGKLPGSPRCADCPHKTSPSNEDGEQ